MGVFKHIAFFDQSNSIEIHFIIASYVYEIHS